MKEILEIVKRCKELEILCDSLVLSDYKIEELKDSIDYMSNELMSICMKYYKIDGKTLRAIYKEGLK